jgi:hypothetical protein
MTIPDGLRPGDVPSGIHWPRRVWLILPDTTSKSQRESIRRVREQLKNHDGIQVSEARVKNTKGSSGTEFRLLPPNEVAGIYRGAHRERTAIIAFCGAKVLLDISEAPTNHGCLTLEKFIRYKCSYALVSRPEEVERALLNLVAWMDRSSCDGPRDPRCLPTAIFTTRAEFFLETHEDRLRFTAHHRVAGRSNTLADDLNRAWQVGPNHTRELLQVAGCTLPIGFHWDVQADSKSSIIATGWETWKLPGRGYTNIHPDAYIRGGNAHKTHPSAAEVRQPKVLRTPRSLRKGKGQR